MDVVSKLKYKVYPRACQYCSHATLVEGRLKNTDEIFRCLFIENDNFMSYMIPRMYRESPVIIKKWRTWIPSLEKTLDSHSKKIDMAIAVLPLKYEDELDRSAHFKSQTLICSAIDTSGTWDDIKSRFQHNKRQFSNKMDKKPMFNCRISRHPADLDFFYNEMYAPHIQKRFDELAFVESYGQMQSHFLHGFLLFVREEYKDIAGVLCEIQNQTLFARNTGILNGDEEYIKRGAASAEYYFTLKYALEHGISKVDLLRSRPFFNDGVYSTKRKWGATVYPDTQSKSWVYFFVPKYSGKVTRFFENNPVMCCKEDKMYAVVGWPSADLPSPKDAMKVGDKYYSPGLEGLMLVHSQSEDPVQISFK
ncbi:MAG: GNAT family protein [Syntrophorhabdaceae bacterium]